MQLRLPINLVIKFCLLAMGGSAGDAQHIAAEFEQVFYDRPGPSSDSTNNGYEHDHCYRK